MKQHTLGTILGDLYEGDFSHRVSVQLEQTGDVDSPGWDTIVTGFDLQIQQASARDRVARAEDYSMNLTHVGFANDDDYLAIGARLVETHRWAEDGTWVGVADEGERWLILGKEKIRGLPEPWNQVRLDLHQLTPTR